MNIGITIIGWFLVAVIGAGILAVKSLETQLKWDDEDILEMDKMERLMVEAFLQQYWDANTIGKIKFVTFHGARLWAILLFDRKGG